MSSFHVRSESKLISELSLELDNISLDGHSTDETIEAIQEQDGNVFTELKRKNEKDLQYKLTQDSYHKSEDADGGNNVALNSIDKQESLEEKDIKKLDEQAKNGALNQESLEENELKNGGSQLEKSKVGQNLDTTSLQETEQTSGSLLKALNSTKFTLNVQSFEQDDIVQEVQQPEDFVGLDAQLKERQKKMTADLLGHQLMDVDETPEWIRNPEINVENLHENPLVQSSLSKISLHLQSVRSAQSSSSSDLSSKKTTLEEKEENKFTRAEHEEIYWEEIRKQRELVKENTMAQHHLCKILRKNRREETEHRVDTEKEDEQGKRFIAKLINYDLLQKRKLADEKEVVALQASFADQATHKVRDCFELWKEMCKKLVKYCREAKYANNAPLPRQRLENLMVKESNKYEQVRRMRTTTISLGHQMDRFKAKIREKNADVDDVSLLDHEQMKMEIHRMFETLQERNIRIEGIKEGVRRSVIRVTHIKEKAQMQREEIEKMRTQREKLEEDLHVRRRNITLLKRKRNKARSRNSKLQRKTGLVSLPLLLSDYEVTYDEISDTRKRIHDLKERYRRTDEKKRRLRKRIQTVEPNPVRSSVRKSFDTKLPLIIT